MVVILMNVFYLFAIIVAVKILRKDSQHREWNISTIILL